MNDRAEAFHRLHIKGDPVILYNAWDAGSAKAVAGAGAKAIATGSWSVAAAHGFEDGEKLPLELALANAERIVQAVDVPVTIDFESGYGDVGASVAKLAETGAVGLNLEDRVIGGNRLYTIEEQSARIRAARDATSVPIFINARCDVFLRAGQTPHDEAMLEQVLERARAYADAGASGLFAPGLADEKLIERLCRECPLPVNIMVAEPPAKRLAELGVARISYGPNPYRKAMKLLEEAARAAFSLLPSTRGEGAAGG